MLLKDRLKQARLHAAKTQGEVAEAVGMSQPAYQALESGRNKKSAFLPEIAKFLDADVHWLKSGGDETINQQSQSQNQNAQSQTQSRGKPQDPDFNNLIPRHDGLPASRQTPVISWVQAGDYTAVLSVDMSNVIEWIPYNPRVGLYGFALIVKGVSMEPMFNHGDRIYVNPGFQLDELHTGDLVIMSCDGDNEATFKELVAEDGEYYLRPLNPNWRTQLMPVNEHCRLVGKVVGRFNNFE